MNKNELLKKYGEYGVPYEVIKNTDSFNVRYFVEPSEILRALNHVEKYGDFPKDMQNLYSDNVPVVMLLDNLDIEFTLYDIEDNKINTGFFICGRYKKVRFCWESIGFADLKTNKDLFKSKEVLERAMYESLIKYAKEHSLKWSEQN